MADDPAIPPACARLQTAAGAFLIAWDAAPAHEKVHLSADVRITVGELRAALKELPNG